MGFRLGCSTAKKIFTLIKISNKSWDKAEDVHSCLSTRKNRMTSSFDKSCGGYCVDCHLILAVNPL